MKKRKEFMLQFDVYYYTEEEIENEVGDDENGKPIFSKETVSVPHIVKAAVRNPTRRQMDDASLEYSAFFGKCMKQGCLTKAMLAKKYAEQGGAMQEDDAKLLENLYRDVEKLNNKMVVLNEKMIRDSEGLSDANMKELHHLSYSLSKARRDIIDIESSYLSLFQSTAEMQAQSRLVLWYMLYLTQVRKGDEWEDYFKGDTFEERCDSYYNFEEEDDDKGTYRQISSRAAMILGFWLLNPEKQNDDSGMSYLETELKAMTKKEESEVENLYKPNVEEGKTESEEGSKAKS